jgi:hypothetical protein
MERHNWWGYMEYQTACQSNTPDTIQNCRIIKGAYEMPEYVLAIGIKK